MINLLNSSFTRLRKNKLSLILILFTICVALFMIFANYTDMTKYDRTIEIEQLMLNYSTMIGITIAIFTSLFLGSEYSDGGNRIKIITGSKRIHIYLCNLIVTSLMSVCAYLLFLVVITFIGVPLFGWISIPLSKFLWNIACILIMILANTSLFTFISMLISSKTVSAVVSIMLVFCFMITSLTLLSRIQAPEYNDAAIMTNSETSEFEIIKERNPKYLTEKQRKVYTHILKFIPEGQAFLIVGRMETNLSTLPLYSLGIIVIFACTGIILFNKKELK